MTIPDYVLISFAIICGLISLNIDGGNCGGSKRDFTKVKKGQNTG